MDSRPKGVRAWRPVKGWEDRYEVNALGMIRKKKCRTQIGSWLSPKGYEYVRLAQPRAVVSVHQIVARAFIPNPDGKPEVNHLDNDRSNNFFRNLEWCTHKENLQYAHRQGRMHQFLKGNLPHNRALTKEDVLNVKALRDRGLSFQRIAEAVGSNKRTVGNIINGTAYVDCLPLPSPISMTLPEHAVRYISELCKMRREMLSNLLEASQYGLQFEAEYDSLNAIESAIPTSVEP